MFKNYFKIAFRNLVSHKSFSLLNITGLAIGMASSILILLWVQHEKSYDRFHVQADHIYRITASFPNERGAAIAPGPLAPDLKARMPAVKNMVRLSFPSSNVFAYENKKFEEKKGFYADSTFLEVFSFPLIAGDKQSALNHPDAVLITEALAKKYFGNTDPIGKTLKKNDKDLVTVTGVLVDVPSNSHLQFDYILSSETVGGDSWDDFTCYSYLLLNKSDAETVASLQALEDEINRLFKTQVPESYLTAAFHAQPLTDIHLHSRLEAELSGNGNVQYVNILFVVAIFILVVACINFMNLSTARSSRRAKEVGLRKVIGASRPQLVRQFLGESMLISFLSLLIAVALVWLAMPGFNYLAGKDLAINLLDGKLLLMLIGIALLTGVLAGSYPALVLSGFQPIKTLKGLFKTSGSGQFVFRNTLVVIQFVVSIALLVGTLVVYRQLQHIKNMNLGYDKSNLIYVPMTGDIWEKQEAYKNELQQNPLTTNFTVTNDVPTNLISGTIDVNWEGKDPNAQVIVPNLDVNESFFDIFEINMLAGRTFSKDFKGDSTNFIINEKLAGLMGFDAENALGKSFQLWDKKGVVIGVVKDFNFKPVQMAIEPMVMQLNDWGGMIVVRTQPGTTEATLKALEKINTALNPGFPFSYSFVDQDLDNLYKGEQRLGNLFNLFALLAIFISCLGLYGLSAFMAEQRIKEIGVRKVLGASVASIVYLLSKRFISLLFLAILLAVPLAWYVMDGWLSGFVYRISIGWTVFLLASLTAIIVALLTVSYESIKAAVTNPIRSLRNE